MADPDGRGPISFEGRVAVVTGAGRGLGREFALLLARRGAAVVVNDVGVSADADRYTNLPAPAGALGADAFVAGVAHAVVDEIASRGGQAVANTADVADPVTAPSIVQDAVAAFGRIDIVINNAGVVPYAPLEELTSRELSTALAVHIGGAFHVCQAAWPYFSEQHYGRVVNICSMEGVLNGSAGFVAYAAAKAGVLGLTRSLATEGEPLGIRANALAPGAATRGNWSVNPGYARDPKVDRSPGLVAPAACWLASDECDVSGRCYASTAASMRELFMSAAAGYQCPRPLDFSLEVVRDNWDTIRSREGAIVPERHEQYNAFRIGIYERTVNAGD
jgi:NAD(P)-dependent dehydrogenase (short-subunit alcohol dehydrogenase family)